MLSFPSELRQLATLVGFAELFTDLFGDTKGGFTFRGGPHRFALLLADWGH
jgi:hypothetical protein